MFCSNCGAIYAQGETFCKKCGQSLAAAPAPYAGQAPTSGKAVASFICGLFFFFLPSAVAAVILGHLSHSEIRRSAGRLKGDALSITGLVLGYFGLAIIPMALIIAAIAVPNLLRARLAANEAAATGSLRTINTANLNYSTEYANGFAPNLVTLDGVESGSSSCDMAGLIDARLASGFKSGFAFRYVPEAQDGSPLDLQNSNLAPARGCSQAGAPRYHVTADPIRRGRTGQRSFYTDESGVIRVSLDGPASADSPPLQ